MGASGASLEGARTEWVVVGLWGGLWGWPLVAQSPELGRIPTWQPSVGQWGRALAPLVASAVCTISSVAAFLRDCRTTLISARAHATLPGDCTGRTVLASLE